MNGLSCEEQLQVPIMTTPSYLFASQQRALWCLDVYRLFQMCFDTIKHSASIMQDVWQHSKCCMVFLSDLTSVAVPGLSE